MRMISRCAVANSGGGLFITILENEVCGVGGNVNTKEERTIENKCNSLYSLHTFLFVICNLQRRKERSYI
jgi:hypothetical protein